MPIYARESQDTWIDRVIRDFSTNCDTDTETVTYEKYRVIRVTSDFERELDKEDQAPVERTVRLVETNSPGNKRRKVIKHHLEVAHEKEHPDVTSIISSLEKFYEPISPPSFPNPWSTQDETFEEDFPQSPQMRFEFEDETEVPESNPEDKLFDVPEIWRDVPEIKLFSSDEEEEEEDQKKSD